MAEPGVGKTRQYLRVDYRVPTSRQTPATRDRVPNAHARPARAYRRCASGTASRLGACGGRLVLVVPAPPDSRLVASLGRTIEPLVGAPEGVESPGVGGIRVVDRAVLLH